MAVITIVDRMNRCHSIMYNSQKTLMGEFLKTVMWIWAVIKWTDFSIWKYTRDIATDFDTVGFPIMSAYPEVWSQYCLTTVFSFAKAWEEILVSFGLRIWSQTAVSTLRGGSQNSFRQPKEKVKKVTVDILPYSNWPRVITVKNEEK